MSSWTQCSTQKRQGKSPGQSGTLNGLWCHWLRKRAISVCRWNSCRGRYINSWQDYSTVQWRTKMTECPTRVWKRAGWLTGLSPRGKLNSGAVATSWLLSGMSAHVLIVVKENDTHTHTRGDVILLCTAWLLEWAVRGGGEGPSDGPPRARPPHPSLAGELQHPLYDPHPQHARVRTLVAPEGNRAQSFATVVGRSLLSYSLRIYWT